MPSSPNFLTRHRIEGNIALDHHVLLGNVIDLFDTVHFVLWDNTGFISRTRARKGIRTKEDAVIKLCIVGRVSTDTMLAIIDINFNLPISNYKDYTQVPISTWNSLRSSLVTYIVTTRSLSLSDGVAS